MHYFNVEKKFKISYIKNNFIYSVLVTQSCPTLWNPMDCSPPGSSVHEIFQARILEWVAMPFSRGSSQPRDRTLVSCIAGGFSTVWPTRESHYSWYLLPVKAWGRERVKESDGWRGSSGWSPQQPWGLHAHRFQISLHVSRLHPIHREPVPVEATVNCCLALLLPVSAVTLPTPTLHLFLVDQLLVFLPYLFPLFVLARWLEKNPSSLPKRTDRRNCISLFSWSSPWPGILRTVLQIQNLWHHSLIWQPHSASISGQLPPTQVFSYGPTTSPEAPASRNQETY